MKISLTGFYSSRQKEQEIYKSCDLVLIPCDYSAENVTQLKELLGNKVIQLTHCDSGWDIFDYLIMHAPHNRDTEPFSPELLIELESIYQALPKGEELEVYTLGSILSNEPPEKITLPYEN